MFQIQNFQIYGLIDFPTNLGFKDIILILTIAKVKVGDITPQHNSLMMPYSVNNT